MTGDACPSGWCRVPGAEAPAPPGTAPRGPALRVRYTKLGRLRFTSHRDVVRMWERALRRSGVPVAWSEGFSPRPVVSFGLALPTGAESLGEYLDIVPEGRPRELGELHELGVRLSTHLPAGMDVQAVAVLEEGSASLQQEVSSCSWKLEVLGLAIEELSTRVERLLGASSVLVERERKGRTVRDDLRPSVLALSANPLSEPPAVVPGGGPFALIDAQVATRPRGVRPRELLEGLGPGVELVRACRVHQWIERDGARCEPLDVGVYGTGPVEARASERAS